MTFDDSHERLKGRISSLTPTPTLQYKVSRLGLGNFVKHFAKALALEIGVDSELRKVKEPIAPVVRNLVIFPSRVQGNGPDQPSINLGQPGSSFGQSVQGLGVILIACGELITVIAPPLPCFSIC